MSSRPTVAARFSRLLAMLAWLAREGSVEIAVLAERFGMAPEEVVDELTLASLCGTYPYSPGELLEIVVDDATVALRFADQLAAPRPLSRDEAVEVAAALRAAVAVPGAAAALTGALGKLERALGAGSLRVDLDQPQYLEAIASAIEEGGVLEIEYYSASRDATGTRRIEPVRTVAIGGHWYADAFCQKVGAMRRFRVDRILSLREVDGDRIGPAGEPPEAGAALQDAERLPTVTLEVPARSGWRIADLGGTALEGGPAGWQRFAVPVAGEAWLCRLVLSVGPDVRLLGDPELSARVAGRIRGIAARQRSTALSDGSD